MFEKFKSKKISSIWWVLSGLIFVLIFGQFTHHLFSFVSFPVFPILLASFIAVAIFTQIKNNRTKKILFIAIKSFIFAMIFGIILPVLNIYITDTVKFNNEIFVFIGITIVMLTSILLGLSKKKTIFLENIIFVASSSLWLYIILPVIQMMIWKNEELLVKLEGLQFMGIIFPFFVVIPTIIMSSIVFYSRRNKLQGKEIK